MSKKKSSSEIFYNKSPRFRILNNNHQLLKLLRREDAKPINNKGAAILFERYNSLYGNNFQKKNRRNNLIKKLQKRYPLMNKRLLKDSIRLYFFIKTIKELYLVDSPSMINNPDSNLWAEEFKYYFIDLENFLKEGRGVTKFLGIAKGINKKIVFNDESGFTYQKLQEESRKIKKPVLDIYEGLKSCVTYDEFLKEAYSLLKFDIDYLLHDNVYLDIFSIVFSDISYHQRLLIMFDVFVITHDLTPGEQHPSFKDLGDGLEKDMDYYNYRINTVKKILSQKNKHSSF